MITPQQAQDMLHYESADSFTAPELCLTAELAAHAPAMAEQIANMHYEYAVQLQMSDGEWHFTDDEFYPFGTPEPRHAEWQTKTGAEELYASFVEDDGPKHIRIVRRLVGESEVVE